MPRSYWTELTEIGTIETVKLTFGPAEEHEVKLVHSASEIDAHLAQIKEWLLEDVETLVVMPRKETP